MAAKPQTKTPQAPPEAKPQAKKPLPAPRASVPPKLGPVFTRPMGESATQRQRRAAARAKGQVIGTITAKKIDDAEGELLLYGYVGASWDGSGITDIDFNTALKDLGDVKTLRLRMNSGGGDVFMATAIYTMLVKWAAKNGVKVIGEVEGVAASAMTLIAMATDELRMSENSQWMIHRATGGVYGNDDDVESYLKLLRNANALLRLVYAKRTGIDVDELVDMMRTDNWMTAQEALDNGFVDAIDEAKSVDAHAMAPAAGDKACAISITKDQLAAMAESLASLAAQLGQGRVAASATTPPVVKEKTMKMNAVLRAACVAAGMLATLDDPAAWAWLDANADKVTIQGATPTTPATPVVTQTPGATGVSTGLTVQEVVDLFESHEKKKLGARNAWRKEVDANISLAFPEGVPSAFASLKDDCYGLQDDGGVDAVRTKLLEAKTKISEGIKTGALGVNLTPNQPSDRHRAAIRAGLMVRCLNNGQRTAAQLEEALPEKDRPADWKDFSRMSLLAIAEQSLLADGWSHEAVRRLNPTQVAQAALGFGRNIGISAAAGLHTTGSLLEVTRDAVNKVMTSAYVETPSTWRTVGRQGASVPDFKEKHVVKLSGAGNVPVWTDNTSPDEAKLANEKEKYAVEARAEKISFSWRLIINDDLDALSRRPQIMGNAMARTVNAFFWQQITANGTMSDGVALFSVASGARKKANLITGSATPTTDTVGQMRKLLRLMVGLNTPEGNVAEDILNLTPKYLVGPATLETTILKLIRSTADPAASGNSGVYNTAGGLEPVIEPLLDGNSATAFYLFADPASIDTVEISFLVGQETPFTHEWMDNETMAQCFTIIQTWGGKAIDWRGMIEHAGA
jgi:ATP-dependent protease ClpP protease subunit